MFCSVRLFWLPDFFFFCSLSRSSVSILFFFSVLISALPTLSTHHPSPINRDTHHSMCVCIYILSAISSTFRFPFYLPFYVHQYFSIFPLSRHSFCSNDANVIRLICISYRKVVYHIAWYPTIYIVYRLQFSLCDENLIQCSM